MITLKLGRLIAVVVVISVSTYSPSALSTLSFKMECPQKFVGKVRLIRDSSTPLNSLSRQVIELEKVQSLKGSSSAKVDIEVLKDGPVKFREGGSYLVELNNGYLCSATEV